MAQTYIPVACGIIEREGKIMAAQRGMNMRHPGKWEFPGGKQEPYESLAECLHRELREELQIEVHIIQPPHRALRHVYGETGIELFAFDAVWKQGEPQLLEHQRVGWYKVEELAELDWAEADKRLLTYWLDLRL